jgi:hypothetical protein
MGQILTNASALHVNGDLIFYLCYTAREAIQQLGPLQETAAVTFSFSTGIEPLPVNLYVAATTNTSGIRERRFP